MPSSLKYCGMSCSIMEMSLSIYPSQLFSVFTLPLMLKAAVMHPRGNQDGTVFDFIVDYRIARHTDAGHTTFAAYIKSKRVSDLNGAVQHFQLVLEQCPVGHPDCAAALTNLVCVRHEGYIRSDLQDIGSTTRLFRNALALRPQGRPDRPISLYHLFKALSWRHTKERTAIDIRESAQISHELLPLCPEGAYLRSITVGGTRVDCVICACNKLPKDASNEGIHFRRIVLELCPLGNQHRPRALDKLSQSLSTRFRRIISPVFAYRIGEDWRDDGDEAGAPTTITMSPNGKSVLDGSDGEVRLWDVEMVNVISKWTGHRMIV